MKHGNHDLLEPNIVTINLPFNCSDYGCSIAIVTIDCCF